MHSIWLLEHGHISLGATIQLATPHILTKTLNAQLTLTLSCSQLVSNVHFKREADWVPDCHSWLCTFMERGVFELCR